MNNFFFSFLSFFNKKFNKNEGLWGLLSKADAIHSDLKPENILFDIDGRALIADLSVSNAFSALASAFNENEIVINHSSPLWTSPEIHKLSSETVQALNLSSLEQLIKSNIFSLGLIALFCLDNQEFEKQKQLNTDEKSLGAYLDQYRIRCPDKLFFYMLKCMLSFSPITRPSIQQLFEDFPEFTSRVSDSKLVTSVSADDFKKSLSLPRKVGKFFCKQKINK